MDDTDEETLLDVQHSPLFKLKRKVLFMTLFLFYLLCGLEYSITIPSALLDRGTDGNRGINSTSANEKYSDADRTYMLTEVGLYPLAAMLTSLFLGHYYDRTKRIRGILLGQCILQVVGNFVYAIHYDRSLSLFGRFVSGLGDGYIAVSIGEVTYLYEDNNRVGMHCILELGRVFGFLNGPVVNYFIEKWSKDHRWTIDKKTLPAYTMGCAWSVLTMVSFCCVHNLALEIIEKFNLDDSPFLRAKTRLYNEEENHYENVEEIRKMLPDPDESNNPFEDTDEFSEEEQKVDLFEPEFEFDHDPDDMYEQPIPQQSTPPPKAKPTPIIPPPKPPLKERIRSWFSIKNYASMKARYHAMKESVSDDSKEILHKSHVSQIYHPEIALLMVMNFVFWFTQTTFLMFASYILPIEYDWPYFYVGLTYVLGFVIIIFILILMYFLREGMMTKHLYVVVIGQALTQISLGLLIYEGVPKSVHDRSIVFIVCGVLVFGSIPCTLVSFKAIMTSLVRPGIQGTLQGVTSSIVRLAVIMGLLLSIVMVQGRQIYASIMTAFCFLTLIAFFLASDRIRLRQREARDGGHKLL